MGELAALVKGVSGQRSRTGLTAYEVSDLRWLTLRDVMDVQVTVNRTTEYVRMLAMLASVTPNMGPGWHSVYAELWRNYVDVTDPVWARVFSAWLQLFCTATTLKAATLLYRVLKAHDLLPAPMPRLELVRL